MLNKFFTKIPFWAKFLFNILFLYTLWLIFFKFLRDLWLVDYIYEEITYYLTLIQLKISQFLLSALGYEVYTSGKIIWVQGYSGILLDKGCLGRNTLGIMLGFILAYPSGLKKKWVVMILGVVIFLILNILRITGLVITQICCPKYLDLNHNLIFKAIVYFVIFVIWYLWLNWLKSTNFQNKKNN